MTADRKAMDPRDIIGKWAVRGLGGAYMTKDQKFGYWTHFSAEALLFNTKAEAVEEYGFPYKAEQVTGLRSRTASLWRDKNENFYGGD